MIGVGRSFTVETPCRISLDVAINWRSSVKLGGLGEGPSPSNPRVGWKGQWRTDQALHQESGRETTRPCRSTLDEMIDRVLFRGRVHGLDLFLGLLLWRERFVVACWSVRLNWSLRRRTGTETGRKNVAGNGCMLRVDPVEPMPGSAWRPLLLR